MGGFLQHEFFNDPIRDAINAVVRKVGRKAKARREAYRFETGCRLFKNLTISHIGNFALKFQVSCIHDLSIELYFPFIRAATSKSTEQSRLWTVIWNRVGESV